MADVLPDNVLVVYVVWQEITVVIFMQFMHLEGPETILEGFTVEHNRQ
jgi:hypothetical protein